MGKGFNVFYVCGDSNWLISSISVFDNKSHDQLFKYAGVDRQGDFFLQYMNQFTTILIFLFTSH